MRNSRNIALGVAILLALGAVVTIIFINARSQQQTAVNAIEGEPEAVATNTVVVPDTDIEVPAELLEARKAIEEQDFEKAEMLFTEAYKKYPTWDLGPSSSVRSESAEALSYIDCLKLMNPQVVEFATTDEALSKIMAAIDAKDFLKLFSYTGCSFVVGFTESDNLWNLSVPDGIPAMSKRLHEVSKATWSLASWSSEDQKFYETKMNERNFVLHFVLKDQMWKWNGFFESYVESDKLKDLAWSGEKIVKKLEIPN